MDIIRVLFPHNIFDNFKKDSLGGKNNILYPVGFQVAVEIISQLGRKPSYDLGKYVELDRY